jgi:extracellular matrix regulatory protein B
VEDYQSILQNPKKYGGIFVFLHLGENVVVPVKDVIGIFDVDTAMYSSDTIQFLRLAEEDGFVERITKEKPKSFVIAEVDKKSKIFLSPISSVTLSKRTEFNYEL